MKILVPENVAFDMNKLPEQIDDLRYCVLDYTNQNDVDFHFVPLIFLDTFPKPVADMQIGKYNIQLPLDWYIIIADNNCGHFELIELRKINDRPFKALVTNPISSFLPEFHEITVKNIYPDMTWYFPKLKAGHFIALPLNDTPKPPCIFLIKDLGKTPEMLDITKIF